MPSAAALAQLEALYREHHGYVWRSLQRLGVPEPHVADAMHDVFLVVARRLHEFEHRAAMRTWLFAIAFRVAQGFHRDRQRQSQREQPLDDPDAGPAPGTSVDNSIALHQLLQRLDDDKRAVFILAHLEGMTAAEIATVLGLKVPTVYSRLRLAREAIERALTDAPSHSPRRAQR
ncbi:sigma-70 family RNA polymerase sigma factor [Nannocystis sp. ILAH1]|uniref:RNA polymerase sigma factor n=1 Tax=unclassified Nannocystis TaxID=2627009 RepID=UPI002271B935|nr:sigma-70 family RNA polymerase sigma factor [Nannocystis sp. ILAH1]MCY1064350.1 sigma-70 family RNA polymerase sigma factor [Nannocystis sp. RBIL2]